MKSMALLSLLSRAPAEFVDRSLTIVDVAWASLVDRPPAYQTRSFANCVDLSLAAMNRPEPGLLDESALATIETAIAESQRRIPSDAPFAQFHNGDISLGRLCYLVARSLRAAVVVETGVCYGVTSSYLLQAIKINGEGRLQSIDLPPLGKDADDYVGFVVPDELREHWTLHRGTSRRLLPPLFDTLGEVDLFVHDSLHTKRNMRMEFSCAWPALRPGGVLIADDVEGNCAFLELASRPDVACSLVMREEAKDSLCGIAVKKV